jgi:hypothetical protein
MVIDVGRDGVGMAAKYEVGDGLISSSSNRAVQVRPPRYDVLDLYRESFLRQKRFESTYHRALLLWDARIARYLDESRCQVNESLFVDRIENRPNGVVSAHGRMTQRLYVHRAGCRNLFCAEVAEPFEEREAGAKTEAVCGNTYREV